jgi:hypothetical protein
VLFTATIYILSNVISLGKYYHKELPEMKVLNINKEESGKNYKASDLSDLEDNESDKSTEESLGTKEQCSETYEENESGQETIAITWESKRHKLGFVINRNKYGSCVESITNPSNIDQGLVENAQIIRINGQSTDNLDDSEIRKIIKAAEYPLTIHFSKDDPDDTHQTCGQSQFPLEDSEEEKEFESQTCSEALKNFKKRKNSKNSKEVLKACWVQDNRKDAIRYLKQTCESFKTKYNERKKRIEDLEKEFTSLRKIKQKMDINTAEDIINFCTDLPKDEAFEDLSDEIVDEALKYNYTYVHTQASEFIPFYPETFDCLINPSEDECFYKHENGLGVSNKIITGSVFVFLAIGSLVYRIVKKVQSLYPTTSIQPQKN